jgi:hypothetical protein
MPDCVGLVCPNQASKLNIHASGSKFCPPVGSTTCMKHPLHYISVLMYHKDCLIRRRSYPGCDMGRIRRRRVCATTHGCTRRKYPAASLWCSSHELAIPPSAIYLQRSCSRGKEEKPSCIQLSQRAYILSFRKYTWRLCLKPGQSIFRSLHVVSF